MVNLFFSVCGLSWLLFKICTHCQENHCFWHICVTAFAIDYRQAEVFGSALLEKGLDGAGNRSSVSGNLAVM